MNFLKNDILKKIGINNIIKKFIIKKNRQEIKIKEIALYYRWLVIVL